MKKIVILLLIIFLSSCKNEEPTIGERLVGKWEVLNRAKKSVAGLIVDIDIFYDFKANGELLVSTTDPEFSTFSFYSDPFSGLYVWDYEEGISKVHFHYPNYSKPEKDIFWNITNIGERYLVVEVQDHLQSFMYEMILSRT